MPKEKDNKNTSPAVKADEEKNEKETGLKLDPTQQLRLSIAIQKASSARDQRAQGRDEFDGLDYDSDYVANKNASNTYLWPKNNDDEVRVVTGTTEKKLEVLSNEIMAMNLQPEAVAYDEDDNELKGLGQDMMDVVKRTGDTENEDDFWQAYIREMLTQRAVFFQEIDEYITINNRPSTPEGPGDPAQAHTNKLPIGKPQVIHRARKMLISGLRVYLGDVNVPARNFQTDQPYIVIYSRYSYDTAKTMYQGWDNWKYVKPGMGDTSTMNPGSYRMNIVGNNEVEELKIIDPINDEYDVIINGIPMMTQSTSLPYEVLPWRRYNVSMNVIKEMDTDFAYGKQPVSSAKTIQALNDEMIRNLVKKFRQAIEPPLGTKNSNVYSKDIWEAGAVTQGISKEDFSVLNPDNKGVTSSEFAMYNLIEKKTEEFIGAGALQQGIAESGEQTATEVSTLQRNAIKNLGHIVNAFMRAKRDAPYLRIYNILENFTKPTKRVFDPKQNILQDVFKRFTIPRAIFEDGSKGKKIVQFMDRNINDEEKQNMFDFEMKEEQLGRPIRLRTINYGMLSSIKVFWHIVVNPQPREGSELMKVLYKDKLTQAAALAELSGGKKAINFDKAADDFEETWSASDFFMKQTTQQSQQPNPEQEELANGIANAERSLAGSQVTEGTRAPTQRPSLNELNQGQ